MITIYQQPIDITYVIPNKFSMSCGASTNVTTNYIKYQWQSSEDGSTAWADVPNTTAILQTMTLTTNDTPVYGESRYFRCEVTEYSQAGALLSTEITEVAQAHLFEGRTNADLSKTRTGSMIRSRFTRHLQMDPSEGTIGIFGGDTQIGEPTLDDATDQITFHNAQSAIIDAAIGFRLPIGGVIATVGSIDPSGKSQQSTITFTGTVTTSVDGAIVDFNMFGRKIKIADNTLATVVRDKAFAVLNEFATKGLYVKDVSKVGDDGIQFTHRDFKPHVVPSWNQYGITMTGMVSSPSQPGYGQWSNFHNESLGGKVVFYWERIA